MIKSFTKYILTLVAILMVTTNAWAGNAKVHAKSDPSTGGYVYVASSTGTYTPSKPEDDATQEGKFLNKQDKTFYLYYKEANNYHFKGWYKVELNLLGRWPVCDKNYTTLTSQGQSVSHKADGGLTTANYYYYAIFATLQNNTQNGAPSFSTINMGQTTTSTVTLYHVHANNVSLQVTGDDARDFTINTSNFQSNYTAGTQTITITFSPTCAGTRTANLKVTNDNGLPEINIPLTAQANLLTQTITWDDQYSSAMFVGGELYVSATASSGQSVTYSSSDPTVISVASNKLTALKEGTATITATQSDGCKYTTVSTQLDFTVSNKKTPTFWLNGNPDQLTDNLKTEDTRTINITNVDATMTADYDPNLLSYTFNGSTATIKALDAGTATLKLTQPENNQIFYGERTFTFNITKYDTNTITNDLATEYLVDDIIAEADIYTINNNEVPVEIISGNNNVLKFENGRLKAVSAGTTTLTVRQVETKKWVGISATKTITVKKHIPTFKWQGKVCSHGANCANTTTEYFNEPYPDYFTTNNTATPIHIAQQTDTDVANIYFVDGDTHTLDLAVYYKEAASTQQPYYTDITIVQDSNRYWEYHTETHRITPKNKNNHVEFIMNTKELRDALYEDHEKSNGKNECSENGEISLNQNSLVMWTAEPLYYTIEFTGIPHELSFDYKMTATATAIGSTKKAFIVYQSEDGNTWEEIWTTNGMPNNNNYVKVKNEDLHKPLSKKAHFLKFFYDGTYTGYYRNIHVTEFNEFEAKVDGQDETTIDTLDFGVVHITDKTEKTMVFNFKYANAGYKVSLDLDQTGGWAEEEAYQEAKKYIEITPSLIDTIGGEKYGEVKNIQVTLHSDDQSAYTIPEDARLKIADEAGHITYVYLKGEIVCTEDQIDWNAYFSLQEPIQIPLSTDSIYNAANTDKYSKLPLKYRSASNGSIIKVSPNGKCFIPAGIGKDTIYAYHDGNNKVCPVESMKIVVVTEKSIQLIDWRDDLSDLIFGSDDNITLTAKVYIIDVVNNTFEYSPEQTANLVYTVADEGESVVSIEEGTTTLKVNGLGETNLTVTIAPNDSLEGATVTIPVVVREPAIGCEDKLLLDQTDPVEIFTEGMNTNQIVKPAIPIDRSKGVPGYLKFEHKGEYWKLPLFGTQFYEGKIKAQQSTDGGNTWTDVPGSEIKPAIGQYYPTSKLPIDTNATHIRFVRPDGGQGYHYYRNVQVYPAQYIETSTNSLNFEKINMGGTYSKTITISYSNIKSPIINSTSSKDITITPASFGECSGFGTQEVTITWNPNTKENQYIIFEDTLIDLSVRVDLIAEIDRRKQAIVWNDRTEAIHNYTDIDNRPTHTIDDNNQQPLLDHPITYEVTAGNAAFENGIFFIKGTGEITIHAYHDGNDAYQRVDSFYQFNVPYMPPTFLGTAGDSLWATEANWANNYVPSEAQAAVILAPLVIRDHKIIINQLLVSDEGSVHITSTGGLTVGTGGIQCSKTDGSAIVIDNLHSGAGFLRVDTTYKGTMPRITMRYQTRSTLDNGANKDAQWQYIGAPGLNSTIYVDYNTWLYKLDEPNNNWVLQPRVDSVSLDPFEGYAITQYGQPTYEWTADMTTENYIIPLTYSKNGRGGRHIIANSYTAPINVAAFTGDEFQFLDGMSTKYRIEKTLYIFNSGSWNNWNTVGQTTTGSSAGQYYAIPVKAAAAQYMTEDIGEQTTIAPMQGIYLRVRSLTPLNQLPEDGEKVGNLVLDYAKLVMGSEHEMHRPMRAPQRTTSSAMQDPNFRRLRIIATSENSGTDRVYIIQDNINTNKFNNGYDATNQETKGLVNIYTNETGGKMEVSCSNNIDSMYIGFMAGSDHTYTLHFSAIIGDILYLQDLDNGHKISIVEGGSYTFEAEPQSTNNKRFLLLASQNTTTDLDIIEPANIWYSNQTLYIANAPYNSVLTLYNISGQPILSTTIHHTPYTIDLSHLANGVYMARLNNQIYKFVCK